jgi:PAS domain-containing protein
MSITVLIVGLAVLFHSFAAILAFRLIKITGHKSAWIFITIAITIQLIRRLMSFGSIISRTETLSLKPDEAIAMTISLFTLIGVALIAPLFLSIRRSEEAMKSAKIKVEEEHAKTESIMAAIGDGISIQDRDLTIVYLNEILISIFGDHRGEKCYQAYNQSEAPCDPCPVLATFEDGSIHTTELSRPTKNGVTCFEVTTSPLRNATGEIISGIMVIRNIDQRKKMERERESLISDLNEALVNIKTLRGLIPTCASCKKIKNSKGNWEQMEFYIQKHSEAVFSHGICPECIKKLYPDIYDEIIRNQGQMGQETEEGMPHNEGDSK